MNRGSKGLSRSLSKPGQAEQGTVLMNRNAPARSSGPGRTGTQSQSSSRRRIGLLALGNEPGAPPPPPPGEAGAGEDPGRLEQVGGGTASMPHLGLLVITFPIIRVPETYLTKELCLRL